MSLLGTYEDSFMAGEQALDDQAAAMVERDKAKQAEAIARPKIDAAVNTLASNNAVEVAPGAEQYDYAKAHELGYDATPNEAGEIYLPNDGVLPGQQYPEGIDMATGKKLMDSPSEVEQRYWKTQQALNPEYTEDMGPVEMAGGYLVGDIEAGPEWLQGTVRTVADMGVSLADSVSGLMRMVGVPEVLAPDIDEDVIGELNLAQSFGSGIGQFLLPYGIMGKALQGVKAAPALKELGKDMAGVFAMNPTEGNVVTALIEAGVLDRDEWGDWDSSQSQGQFIDRLKNTATDSVALFAVLGLAAKSTRMMLNNMHPGMAGYDKAMDFYKSVYGEYVTRGKVMEIAKDRIAGNLVAQGRAALREGVSVFNGGDIPLSEGAGVSKRAGKVREAMDMIAQGYALQGSSREAFKASMDAYKLPGMDLNRIFDKQSGMVGWHGTHARFNKFDHSNIGSGEGAQMYGWGTYVAEHPDVAKSYAPRAAAAGADGVAAQKEANQREYKRDEKGRFTK